MTSVAAIIEQNKKPEPSDDRPRFQEKWEPVHYIPTDAKPGDMAIEIKKSNRRPFPRYSFTQGTLRDRNGEKSVSPFVSVRIEGQFGGIVSFGQQAAVATAQLEDAFEWIAEAAHRDMEEYQAEKATREQRGTQQQRPVRVTGKTERDRAKKKGDKSK